jgi:restriction system protein
MTERPPHAKFSFWPSHVEAEPHPIFVGRANELRDLRQTLEVGGIPLIVGRRGSGKTALLRMYQMDSEEEYPGGTACIQGQTLFASSIVEEIRRQITIPTEMRTVLIVDDAHALTRDQLRDLHGFLDVNPKVCLIAAADESFQYQFRNAKVIHLGALSQQEYYAILNARLKATDTDPEVGHFLWEATAGNPLFANIANRTIRDQLLTWQQLLDSLQGFKYSGIVDSVGRPLSSKESIPSKLIAAVESTNCELLARLSRDPREFWAISPRKFEEIVAELLKGLGYEVELTPFSGDGGFDMYAARSDAVGRFLFLVATSQDI